LVTNAEAKVNKNISVRLTTIVVRTLIAFLRDQTYNTKGIASNGQYKLAGLAIASNRIDARLHSRYAKDERCFRSRIEIRRKTRKTREADS
jgi:hypothetical protein